MQKYKKNRQRKNGDIKCFTSLLRESNNLNKKAFSTREYTFLSEKTIKYKKNEKNDSVNRKKMNFFVPKVLFVKGKSLKVK